MKYLISIIKFFNKRELEVLYRECRNRSNICSMAAINAKDDDIHYLSGEGNAYREMADFIEKRIKEEK